MDSEIFNNSEEQRRHQNMIDSLAKQFGTTVDTISVLYEGELRKLSVSARIRDYLPILTARIVRDTLTTNTLQYTANFTNQSAVGHN